MAKLWQDYWNWITVILLLLGMILCLYMAPDKPGETPSYSPPGKVNMPSKY